MGEIYDEFDKTEIRIRKQSDGTYIVDALVPLQVIQQKFKVPIKVQGYITIGRVVFGLLGKEPKLGDTIQIGSVKLKVKEIEKKRIKTLILSKVNIKK